MEINRWIPNCVTEKILTSFQKRILNKLHEPTTKRSDLHEVLKMDSFSSPYGDGINEEETSFITSYDIFSSELENRFRSETIKNNTVTSTSQNQNVHSTAKSKVFSASGIDPEQSGQCNERVCGVLREKRVKVKIFLPKKQLYSPLLAQNNIYLKMLEKNSEQPNNDSIAKIVEELVLERYRHLSAYHENKRRERSKRKIKIDDTTNREIKTQHENVSQNTSKLYDLTEEMRYSKSLNNLDEMYSYPKVSQDHSLSDSEISDLLTAKCTTTTNNSLSPCPTYTSIPVLYDTQEEEEEEEEKYEITRSHHRFDIDKNLSKKAVVQDRIINQISTVVEFCKKNRNLQGYIEAERLLLLANYERKLNSKQDNIRPDLPTTGIVTILNISLSVDEQDLFITAPSKIYYVCIFTYNRSIVSSGTAVSDEDGRIKFDKEVTIKNLPSDFVIEASLYALRLPECFEYRGKYVISSSQQKHISPRRLFVSGSSNFKQNYSKSSFCLVGTFNLSMEDVGRVKNVSIRNMVPEFVILSQGKLQMNCDVLDIGHPINSYVDLGFRIGNKALRWNRLWGSIGKMDIKFWKYPNGNPDYPVVTIDLKSCLNKKVTNVDHETCMRPRTLQLEFEEPDEFGSYQKLMLSFDSLDDMIEWKNQLNCLIPWIKRM